MSLKGHSVNLFSFYGREIEPVSAKAGIRLDGDVEGFASLNRITTRIDEAVRAVDLIMVIMPALAHGSIASLLSGCIADGQVLLLSPGRTGGALEVYDIFRRYQMKKNIVLGECQTFLYATESRGPAHVEIMKVKNRVRAAALPAGDNEKLLDVMNRIYPEYAPASNVLETSINNTGALFDIQSAENPPAVRIAVFTFSGHILVSSADHSKSHIFPDEFKMGIADDPVCIMCAH